MSGNDEEHDEFDDENEFEDEKFSGIQILRQELETSFERLEERLANPNLPLTQELKKTLKVAKNINENMTKFMDMLKEFKGSIAICRSLLRERNDMTPRWYKLADIDAPHVGEIWVKDIDGNETIATCRGRAIVFPASSSVKAPLFWKPV